MGLPVEECERIKTDWLRRMFALIWKGRMNPAPVFVKMFSRLTSPGPAKLNTKVI